MEEDQSPHLHLHTIRSEIKELEEIYANCNEAEETVSSHSHQIIEDCVLHLEDKVQQIMTDCSDSSFLGIEDLDAFVEHLKEELDTTEAETARISNEIEVLARNHVEDCTQLERNIELLKYSLDYMSPEDTEKEKQHASTEDLASTDAFRDHEFEILKLDNQIDKSKKLLKSLQDFDSAFRRLDAVQQIEEALSGLKVIEFDGTFIRLALRTYLPKLEDLVCQTESENATEPPEIDHELLIEVVNGTMELKNVEIFPNDVYINDIIDAAKSFRQLSHSLLMETRSSLEWFVRKVQDRIILCTVRRLLVKNANKSRHSFKYLDRDDTIVAQLVGGVDAYIKLCQGWPLSSSPLKLISLKSSDHHSKEISLSFLCRVEDVVNSLDMNSRLNLSSFAEAIEKLLVKQMSVELRSETASKD